MTVVTSVLTLPGRPESARAAREFTAACLRACPSVFEAMLCTDELAVNAIQHSRSGLPGGQITIRVETQPGELYVEVADQGPRLRAVPDDPGEAGELAEHGRGLDLVRILASEVGAGVGLHWFRMAWAQARVPAPRPACPVLASPGGAS
jgi:anti-sigma regulatory factor (Ser/Thr protein kinase)